MLEWERALVVVVRYLRNALSSVAEEFETSVIIIIMLLLLLFFCHYFTVMNERDSTAMSVKTPGALNVKNKYVTALRQKQCTSSTVVCFSQSLLIIFTDNRVTTLPGISWIFSKISSTWRVLENEFGPGKSSKLKFKVLEGRGIYLSFNLTNMIYI